MRKIAVVTSNRADFGPLYWLIKSIQSSQLLQLQLVVSGSHFSFEHGLSIKEIEEKNIPIASTVKYLNSDNIDEKSKQLSLAIELFSDSISNLKPDMIILFGDRYELLAFASVALVEAIPIAHISGGEITSGAFDDAIRHAVTKLSYWHFVANEAYAQRVIQLGESLDRVFVVGDIALEHVHNTPLLSLQELEDSIGFSLDKPYLLVTYHPVTWSSIPPLEELNLLLSSLERCIPNYKIIITYPNCDGNTESLVEMLLKFEQKHKAVVLLIESLGFQRYLTALKYAQAVVGNSSSGIFEAASYKTPTVNIGERQQGRLQSKTVINVAIDGDIVESINEAAIMKNSSSVDWSNPYGDGHSAEKIVSILCSDDFPKNNKKYFFDIENR